METLPAILVFVGYQLMTGSEKINYRQTSNISRTGVGNKVVDHSDVVGPSSVGATPTAMMLLYEQASWW